MLRGDLLSGTYTVFEYERERAIAYARRWAFGRNPLFYNFTGIGGDCTNFISQCLLAGCCVMNYTPGFRLVLPLRRRPHSLLERRALPLRLPDGQQCRAGPFGRVVVQEQLQPGDIIQLGRGNGEFYHTPARHGQGERGPPCRRAQRRRARQTALELQLPRAARNTHRGLPRRLPASIRRVRGTLQRRRPPMSRPAALTAPSPCNYNCSNY